MLNCPRIFVIGIDGGSWNIINEYKSDLTSISRLRSHGIEMKLRSTVPPVTCPAWKSFTTGLTPDELRVYWWAHVDFNSGKFKYFYSNSFNVKEIWDYLGSRGYKSLVINVPLTFPPKPINGVMISGFPATNSDNYTWPPELKTELEDSLDYRVAPLHHVMLEPEKALSEMLDLIRKRFEALYYITERESFDFIMTVIFGVDLIQHFYWDDKDAIKNAYLIIDSEVSKLVDQCPQSNFIILSDHGFSEIKDVFYINKYLLDKKLLKLKPLKRLKLLSYIAEYTLRNRYSRSIVARIYVGLPRSIQTKIKHVIGFHDEHGLDKIIDIKDSYVIGLKQGPIFINRRKLEEDGVDYNRFKENLIMSLSEISHPSYGRLVREFYEVKAGEWTGDVPDLIILPNEGFEIDFNPLVDSYWESNGGSMHGYSRYIAKWRASHTLYGVFIAYGDEIQRLLAGRIDRYGDGIPIWDIANYVLRLFNLYNVNRLKVKLSRLSGRRFQ